MSRKILVASMGVATMSYVIACGGSTEQTGGEGGPDGSSDDALAHDAKMDHATVDEFPVGNLVANPDTGPKDGSMKDTIDEFPVANLVAVPDSGKD